MYAIRSYYDALPADFKRIPPDSKAGVVLASVAGTPQAKEALIANTIVITSYSIHYTKLYELPGSCSGLVVHAGNSHLTYRSSVLRKSIIMNKYHAIGLAALLLSLCNPPAFGAGLWLYEMGTPDVGTASAGMASRAADAATAFANPAGMTRLKESQLMVGIQPIYADIKFDTQYSTFGGGDGGNAGGLVPTGSLSSYNFV